MVPAAARVGGAHRFGGHAARDGGLDAPASPAAGGAQRVPVARRPVDRHVHAPRLRPARARTRARGEAAAALRLQLPPPLPPRAQRARRTPRPPAPTQTPAATPTRTCSRRRRRFRRHGARRRGGRSRSRRRTGPELQFEWKRKRLRARQVSRSEPLVLYSCGRSRAALAAPPLPLRRPLLPGDTGARAPQRQTGAFLCSLLFSSPLFFF